MRKSRRKRWWLVIGLTVLLLLGAGFAVLRTKFEGAPLADTIGGAVNKAMRGRIKVGAVNWQLDSLKKVVTGGWAPIEVHDVRVWDDCALSMASRIPDDELRTGDPNEDCTEDENPDPDPTSRRKPRKLLLRSDLITAEIDVHALMFGNHDLVFRNVRLHGGEALLEQTLEPYPLHAYDKVIVSIITAFYPRMTPGFRAGIYADSAPPLVDIRDLHIEHLNLTVHLGPSDVELSTAWKSIQRATQATGDAGKTYFPENSDIDPDRVTYAVAGRIEDLNVDAGPSETNDSYFYMDGVDPLVSKFYVRMSATGARGNIRLHDVGLRHDFHIPDALPEGKVAWPIPNRHEWYNIDLADIRINRLAQLPTEWPRKDYVANTIELDIQGRTLACSTPDDPHAALEDRGKKGALLHLTGEVHDYWDRPYDGAWNLAIAAKNLGPTIRTCINSKFGGDNLEGAITVTGPFVALPRIGLFLRNLDFDVPLGGDDKLPLTLAEVQGSVDLVNEVGSIDKTTALIRNGKEPGELVLSANFGYKPYNARAHVEITKAIDIGRFLPPKVATSVGRFLQGRLSAIGDLDKGFALEDFDLALGANPNQHAIRVHQGRLFTGDKGSTIQIQNVEVLAGSSHATVDGAYDVDNRAAKKIKIVGEFPDLDLWLHRFDLPVLAKSAGGGTTIIINGPIAKPTVQVATNLTGVPCLDKVHVGNATYDNDFVDVSDLTSAGLGGSLTGRGRLNVKMSPPYAERLHFEGRRLDASRLCGLKGKVKGILDTVDVDMSGSLAPRASPIDYLDMVELEAHADHLNVMGEAFSTFGVCVNRGNDKTCRPRTSYLLDDDLAACEQAKRDRKKAPAFCAVASAKRDAGGTVDATVAKLAPARSGRGTTPARLAGTISAADVPLSLLDGVLKTHAAGGLASVTLHLDGSPSSPTATGAVQLLRTWVAGAFIGDAQLAVSPTTLGKTPALAVHGTALAGRLEINGTLGTEAPYPVQLAISGHRVELDTFVDLQKRLGLPEPVQGWASGTITVKTELAPVKPVEPEAWVELTELRAILTHKSSDGRVTPLVMNAMCRTDPNDPAAKCAFDDGPEHVRMSILATPSSIEFACRDPKAPGGRVSCGTKFATPAGVVLVKGYARPKGIAIDARGTLELDQVAPLVDATFDQLSGQAELSASVTGTFLKPQFEASLALKNVLARPQHSITVLEPSGLIRIANNSLGFTDFKVKVHSDDKGGAVGELHVRGNVELDGLTPKEWHLLVGGTVAGEMLLVAAPGALSQASGVARIDGDLEVTGPGKLPLVTGGIVFKPLDICPTKEALATRETPDGTPCRAADDLPLSILPRGVRKEVTLDNGRLDIATSVRGARHTYTIKASNVGAKVDVVGEISGINGSFDLTDGAMSNLDLTLQANRLPFRIPGTLDLTLSAKDVRIHTEGEGDSKRLYIGDSYSHLTIEHGEFIQGFALADTITTVASSTPRPRPFWEEYPLIGSAELHFDVDVTQFAIKNNIANIELQGRVEVSNTPRDPRVSGQIRVQQGTFRIPGTRASFERTTGGISFSPNGSIDPELEVKSDADYRDPSGQDHVITLRIFGRLSTLQWDLKTSTGYNKSQTLSLLVLGRNQEQLRRSLGDQQIGNDPTRGDPTTNPSQGFADQIVKDLAGDWVSGLLGDSLSKITGFDLFRIEIGFGSIGIRLEKKLADNFKIIGTTEQTIRGNTNNARAEYKATQNASVQGGALRKNFNDPAEEDILDLNLKLVLRHIFW